MGRANKDDDAPLIISLSIEDCTVRRILVDMRSAANVLFHDAVTQMGISEDRIRTCHVSLIGFTERTINSNGIIELHVKVHGVTWNAEFLVVDAPSSYNGLLGRPTLNEMKTIVI